MLVRDPKAIDRFVRFDGKIVFIEREIDYCGIERDQTEDALGCLILVPRPVLYVAEIALKDNLADSIEIFTRILRTTLSNTNNLNYLQYQTTLCEETGQQSLKLTGRIPRLLKKLDDPTPPQANIPARKSSDFLMKMTVEMAALRKIKLNDLPPHEVGKDLIEIIRSEGKDLEDIGSFTIKDASDMGHSWLAFVDWRKLKADDAKLVNLESKSLHLDLINKYKNKDLDDALDEKVIAGPRETDPVAKFVSGTYGSGKSVTIKEYLKSRGDIPSIGADVFKAHLRVLGKAPNATSSSLHVASSTLARNARKRLQDEGRSYIFEGSNISRSVADAINSGLKADISIRVIPTELSALRVLKRRVGGDDPNIPLDVIAANGKLQNKLLEQLSRLKSQYSDQLDLEIIIPKRDGSRLLADSNGFQSTSSFRVKESLPQEINAETGFTAPKEGFEDLTLRELFENETIITKKEADSIKKSLEAEWSLPPDSWLDITLANALGHKAKGLKTPPTP